MKTLTEFEGCMILLDWHIGHTNRKKINIAGRHTGAGGTGHPSVHTKLQILFLYNMTIWQKSEKKRMDFRQKTEYSEDVFKNRIQEWYIK